MADDDDDDITDYFDPENEDDVVQAAVDKITDADGDNLEAAQAAEAKSGEFYELAQQVQNAGQDYSVYYGMGKFFGDVADMLLKQPEYANAAAEPRVQAWKVIRNEARDTYKKTQDYIQSRPDLTDQQLTDWGYDIARRSIHDCPYRNVIIHAINDELRRRHRAAAPRQGLQPGSDAAGAPGASPPEKMMQFYIDTRRYAKGLAWAGLWSQYWTQAAALESANADLVTRLRYKCYANEMIARYRASATH